MIRTFMVGVLSFFLLACSDSADKPLVATPQAVKPFSINYEQFELENGLTVIFHVDRSDPVVAVALTAHVGSAREKSGRTGFAHLFEHLLFLESENLGKGGLDQMSARIGGSGANGSTSRDRTNYFQTVPNDALEKMLWAEADKLGWFINTVTDDVLAKEKEVVKNEKRASVDNRPYGHTQYVIDQNLYPEGHPYSWQVIGSLNDLQSAELSDVSDFFKRWYVPNNVTLVVSGDFDEVEAKAWVHKYFDEIPRGEMIRKAAPQPALLKDTVELVYEDNFATLPRLTMVWPGVERYHPDSYPLAVLQTYLSEGKSAPLNQVIIDERKLSPSIFMYDYNSELAGQIQLSITGYEGTHLDDVQTAVFEALNRFETEGISSGDLDRIKAIQEASFYRSLSSVLGKGFNLAEYQIFTGDPGYVSEDIENILEVSSEDVMRVYHKYIKDHHFVSTSFVPQGQLDLGVQGAKLANVVEEVIIDNVEPSVDLNVAVEYQPTPSTFDRSVEPPYGAPPRVNVPLVSEVELSNGANLLSIYQDEVPLVEMSILISGGQLSEQIPGAAYLTAAMLNRGTQNKSRAELEKAIEELGASISITADTTVTRVDVSVLSRNLSEVVLLLVEMLSKPAWNDTEFNLLIEATQSQFDAMMANPQEVAVHHFNRLMYGEESAYSRPLIGTESALSEIKISDLRHYFDSYLSAKNSSIQVVSSLSDTELKLALAPLEEQWTGAVSIETSIEMGQPINTSDAGIYFYDMPGAKQSVIYAGNMAMPITSDTYYPSVIMNYRLGGGGFASVLTQELRESKGYTYGIRSRVSADENQGIFNLNTNVRTNVTAESLNLIRDILASYGNNFNASDLKITQSALIKSTARQFETLSSKRQMLENMAQFGWPSDYVIARQHLVIDATVEMIKGAATPILDPNQMIWLVVGDKETQFEKLNALGLGEITQLN